MYVILDAGLSGCRVVLGQVLQGCLESMHAMLSV